MRLCSQVFNGYAVENGSPNALLALAEWRATTAGKHLATARAGDSRATIRMRVVRFWSLVIPPFRDVRVAFSSRTVPQGSQVTQKFLPLKIASLATLAALLVAVASVFFFCFARPPLIPQGEKRKMFLTPENFYKKFLRRQKSHPAMKPSGCVKCSYCCDFKYSSNCPRMVCRRLLTALWVL